MSQMSGMCVVCLKYSERRVENKTSLLDFCPEPHPILVVFRKYTEFSIQRWGQSLSLDYP